MTWLWENLLKSEALDEDVWGANSVTKMRRSNILITEVILLMSLFELEHS